MTQNPTRAQTVALTVLTMIAFAANSLLCRMALGGGAIDAASFTTVRLAAGALTLWLVVFATRPAVPRRDGDWLAALMLVVYAATFSFAYLSLSVGTGALILFGAVQLTMMGAGLRHGETFTPVSWIGFGLAILGLIYLVSPGLTAPAPVGAGLMAAAGVAWGFYSLRGRAVAAPLVATAGNFARGLPFALLVSAAFIGKVQATWTGALLAVASGAVASGLGYVIWYAALRGLTATRAATVQLSVPAIAAFGGAAFLSERISVRLLIASAAILGGVGVVLMQRASHTASTTASGAGQRREIDGK